MEEDILKGKTLLVVDDEVDLRDIMASELEFMGAKVHQAGSIAQAKEVLKSEKIDLIVSDIRMPGGTGVDLLDYVKAQNPYTPPVILVTGFADITIEDAYAKGAEALLNKPFKLDDLIQTVARDTVPVESRFVDVSIETDLLIQLGHEKTLSDVLNTKEFQLGRGGMAMTMKTPPKKIEVGEEVRFDIRFTDTTFKGSATVRWLKLHENGMKVHLGLEFSNLERSMLDYYNSQVWTKPLINYIPSL